MRVLDTYTGQFVDINDPSEVEYAILSHTWDPQGEQTYQGLQKLQQRFMPTPPSQPLTPRPMIPNEQTPLLSDLVMEQGRSVPPPSVKGSPPEVSTPSRVYHGILRFFDLVHIATSLLWSRVVGVFVPIAIWDDPRLSDKVKRACFVARDYGHRYLWIDSCCIDKTSSSELSEAINSMYAWYCNASVCYAFLADVPSGDAVDIRKPGSAFRQSRWFKRGWTLQELIAPRVVVFLSADWRYLCTKSSLVDVISEVTGVSASVLIHLTRLQDVSVAERMSWASERTTTRLEDEAYSLLGIFNINMPTLYGEGRRAFFRLQEEILRRIPDQTVLVWGLEEGLVPLLSDVIDRSPEIVEYNPKQNSKVQAPALFADRPGQFGRSRGINALSHSAFVECLGLDELPLPTYVGTPFGMPVPFPLIHINDCLSQAHNDPHNSLSHIVLAMLACECGGNLIAILCSIQQPDPSHKVIEATKLRMPGSKGSWIDRHRYLALSPSQLRNLTLHVETLYVPTQSSGPSRRITLPSMSFNPLLSPWCATILQMLGYTVSCLRDSAGWNKIILSKSNTTSLEFTFGPPYRGSGGELWIYHVDPQQAVDGRTSIPLTRPHRLTIEQVGDSQVLDVEDPMGRILSMRLTVMCVFGSLYLDIEILSSENDGRTTTSPTRPRFPTTSRERAIFWHQLGVLVA